METDATSHFCTSGALILLTAGSSRYHRAVFTHRAAFMQERTSERHICCWVLVLSCPGFKRGAVERTEGSAQGFSGVSDWLWCCVDRPQIAPWNGLKLRRCVCYSWEGCFVRGAGRTLWLISASDLNGDCISLNGEVKLEPTARQGHAKDVVF